MGAAATFIIGDSFFSSPIREKGGGVEFLQKAVGKGPKAATPSVSGPPITNDADNENQAQKAAERRRRLYAGIGRSSTILTGPSGLGSLGDNNQTPKMLLGV